MSRWVARWPAANSLEPLPWILITGTADGRVAGQRRYVRAAYRVRPPSCAQKPSCPLTPCALQKSTVGARHNALITTAHGRRGSWLALSGSVRAAGRKQAGAMVQARPLDSGSSVHMS